MLRNRIVDHGNGAFRVKLKDSMRLRRRKSEIDDRLDPRWQHERANPVIGGANLSYEVGERTQAISYGGIGRLARMSIEQ